MKVCGIIAEFNPLHNGHARLISKARQITGADYLIVVMSGDYVQRGEPALLDKYTRAEHALLAGADLVLELPLPAATGSARYFARGAVSTLAHTGVVDTLLFGSESGNLETIRAAGSKELILGRGDHTGRATATDTHLPPNDLLAAEYLRALSDLKIRTITPFTIPRSGAGHHDSEPSGRTASASYLRERLLSSKPETIEENQAFAYVPILVSASLQDYRKSARFLSLSDFSEQIAYILLRERAQGYTKYFDVFDDLSDKIRRNLEHYTDINAFINLLKSKDIAYSHLSRALLHILLGIRKDDVELFCRKYNYCPWLRPLAFRKTAYLLMHAIRENGDRRILSKLADAEKQLDRDALRLLHTDLSASELYAHHAKKTGGIPSEYRRSPVILS